MDKSVLTCNFTLDKKKSHQNRIINKKVLFERTAHLRGRPLFLSHVLKTKKT